ncbi:MAG: allophanate hydrolase subunit 2 family protein, partial [Sulfurovum sp.]|nr:allophanate hydrolase subunit 2 family protein [Sulfurovum sp.]
DLRRVPKPYIPLYAQNVKLRISLHNNASEEILSQSYTLSQNISAMGYKLQGKALSVKEGGIISEGIAFGALQVPPDGQPIILLKERQSIGGYENVGTVLAKDCFALAQAPIGATVTFESIEIKEAQKEMKDFYTFFD